MPFIQCDIRRGHSDVQRKDICVGMKRQSRLNRESGAAQDR
jgi:hypothetical protein